MNFKIHTHNYFECAIIPTEEEPNDINVFNSFNKAKNIYIKNLRVQRDMWNKEVKKGLKLSKKQIINSWK